MTGSGMQVRCLASTRISDWRTLKQREHGARDYESDADRLSEDLVSYEEEQVTGEGLKASSPATTSGLRELAPCSPSSAEDSERSVEETLDQATHSTSASLPTKHRQHTSCIQDAQLSPDGTCIFTSDYDRTFSVYPIDTGILSYNESRPLQTYARLTSPNPIWAFAASPKFNLLDASSTHVLLSRRDSYITLHNALWDITQSYDATDKANPQSNPVDISKPITSYKLIDHLTEAVVAPLSLAYNHPATHFFAGKQNSIAIFDLEHTTDPIHTIPTIPSKRNKLKGGGRGFKGWISALALSPPSTTAQDGLLAAGARTRYIGIYDALSGGEVTHFSLPGTIDGQKVRNARLAHVMGDGVSQLKWSPCARYLYVAERQSDALLIYDVRNFALCLAYCAGRNALTKQKLGFDVWNAGTASPYDIEAISHEVWAGGVDGAVRIWRDPCMKEGAVQADEVVKVHDGSMPVVSTLVHASGSLAVAACGKIEVDAGQGEAEDGGVARGGGLRPRIRENGSLDILGLG
ncbi:hypothetical protein ACN47E_010053 [Coniothyrium glycines]